MPVLAAPVLASIIGAGGSIGGALLARKSQGQANQAASQGLSAESLLAGTEAQAQQFGTQQAQQILPGARQGLDEVSRYFQTLLGGSRQAIMQQASPEVGSILSQYDTAKRSAAEFAPRGGGRTSAMAELPFKKAASVQGLLSGERTQAAQGLAGVAGTEAGLASSLLARPSGAAGNLLSYALAQRGQNIPIYEQMGTSVGNLIYQIYKSQAGGGGGSTSASDFLNTPAADQIQIPASSTGTA